MIGPELGVTQPGMTVVCGDSHTATHGAFGALAFGIGTSEVEHVLATQCLAQAKPHSMRIRYEGDGGVRRHREGPDPRDDRPDRRRRRRRPRRRVLRPGDRGALDGGPHDGLQHDDRGRRARRHGRAGRRHLRVVRARRTARGSARRRARRGDRRLARRCAATTARASTARSSSTRRRSRRRSPGAPTRGWSSASRAACPRPTSSTRPPTATRSSARSHYMGLEAGTPIEEIRLDRVFIGSCTNSRIGDLRAAAAVIRGRRVADGVNAMVVPGSAQVSAQAEAEGLDEVFRAAGFDWRSAGCSMCLGMNPDILAPGERCASTSNRNFEGRQGRGGRTHLVSPGDGRGGGDRGAFRRHPQLGADHGADHHHRRRRLRPRPRRRRHRPDHPQAVPQADRANRLRRVPVLRLGEGAGLGSAGATRS